MIIHHPEISKEGVMICVSARIELETPKVAIPDRLWFTFPEHYDGFVTERADGFVTALLLPAMALGEDIAVRGKLSPRLARGLTEYQRVFNGWFPKQFKLVNVTCDDYQSPVASEVAGGTACAFSGGVDSFYTLWSHLPRNEPISEHQISYGLFVHGFDIGLGDEKTYRIASRAYQEMMGGLGLQLLTAHTNVRHFNCNVHWDHHHGAALIGVALVLSRSLARFYMPVHENNPRLALGSHSRLDHLLSTETFEVIHDGGSVTRTEKTAIIAQWPETYTRLRVCWVKPNGLKNCCRCEKCIRTMIPLDMLGALPLYETFPLPLKRRHIRFSRLYHDGANGFWFAKESIDLARALGRNDIVFDLRCALLLNRLILWAKWGKREVTRVCKFFLAWFRN